MMTAVKVGAGAALGTLVLGGAIFGGDLISYMRTGAGQVRSAVKDNVPLDFELARARDMVDQIIPEMQGQIKLIAQEEVAVEAMRAEIAEARDHLASEASQLARLRDMMRSSQAVFAVGGRQYERDQVAQELGRRFDRFQEAKVMLEGRERILASRENALAAAISALQKTRSQKAVLEDKIAGLEAQYRLVQAASMGSQFELDSTKLAQTQKLIDEIHNRLEVAERVMAHEAKFVEQIPLDLGPTEEEVLARVDRYFAPEVGEVQAHAPAAGDRADVMVN